MKCRQGLSGRLDACRQVDHLLGEGVQPVRGVDHQVAQLLEGAALRLEFVVGSAGGHDDAGQQIAALRLRLGDRVVEDLAHVEGLRQCRSRIRDGLGERGRVLLAEFLHREGEFVVAGAHGVVDLDDDRLRQVVERIDRERGQGVGIGRVDPLRGGELRLTALALPAPAPHHQREHREQQDGEEDHDSYPGDTPRRGAVVLQTVRGCGRGACPVALAQGGFDLVAAEVGLVGVAQDRGPRQQRVVAVLGRDGEDGILVGLKVVDAHRPLRPVDTRLAGEVVDEDDPQPDPPRGVEVVDRALDLGHLGWAEDLGVVGDVAGQPHRGRGTGDGDVRRRQRGHRQHREKHAHQPG